MHNDYISNLAYMFFQQCFRGLKMVYSYCEFETVVFSNYTYEYVSIDSEDNNRSMVKDTRENKIYSILTSLLLPEYVYDRNRNS